MSGGLKRVAEVESVAYIMCDAIGLDAGDYSCCFRRTLPQVRLISSRRQAVDNAAAVRRR